MTKIIRITTCQDCPNNDHRGAFGQVAYVPYCRLENKEQPWEPVKSGTMVVAQKTVDIPDWCPLENYDETKNKN